MTTPNRETHISSLIVYVRPEQMNNVKRTLEAISDCDIAAENAAGKIVLVIETQNTHSITHTIERIQSLAGVINTVLAYHHCEDESALGEPMHEEQL